MDQDGPVVEGLHLDSLRQFPGIEVLHLSVHALQNLHRLIATLEQDHPFHHVIPVIDPNLAKPHPVAHTHCAEAFHKHWRSVLLGHHYVFDVVQAVNKSEPADVKILGANRKIVTSDIGIAIRQRGDDLGQTHAIADQGPGIDIHVVFFGRPAERSHVNHARDPLKLPLQLPILKRLQLRQGGGSVPDQLIAINLGDGPPGRERRLHLGR